MTPVFLGLLFFVLALTSLVGAVAVNHKHPRIALAFEGAAVGCVLGMVQAAAALHGMTNGG